MFLVKYFWDDGFLLISVFVGLDFNVVKNGYLVWIELVIFEFKGIDFYWLNVFY